MSNAERWIEALTHLPMYWLSAVAWYFQWISWQQISLFYFLALLGTGLMVWWIPFLAGPSQKWIATYKRKYAGLRPAFSSQSPVVPTLEIFIHHFLQLLVLSLMILSFLK
ncbi:MAG: hypothetical protein MUF42_11485 [Cytophagaceae bacterium]|nr:hypothetical protein [Cytophagaceae bacterium]